MSRGAEPGLVAIMEEDPAAKRVLNEYRPPSPRDAIAFIVPVERELDGRQTVALSRSIVHARLDYQEPHRALASATGSGL